MKLDLDYTINKTKLNNINYFSNKDKNFLSYIGNLLKPNNFLKGEIIFYRKEPAEEMFFIQKGNVSVYSLNNVKIYTCNEGNYFGEWDFFFNNYKRKYKCIANSDCTLYSLNKIDFENIYFNKFVNERQTILSNSFKRYKDIRYRIKKNLRTNNNISNFKVLNPKQKQILLKAANSFIEKRRKNIGIQIDINLLNYKINRIEEILLNQMKIINSDYFNNHKIKKTKNAKIQTYVNSNKFSCFN